MKPFVVSVRLYRECEDDAQLIKHLETAFAKEKRSGGKAKVLRKIFNTYFKGHLPSSAAPGNEHETFSNVVLNANPLIVTEQAMTNNEDWKKT